MKRPRGGMTWAEYEVWLKETGQYEEMVERHRKIDEEQAKRKAEYRRAEAPLVEELRAAGFQVQSVWDFVNTRDSYPKALPILLAHLPKPYPAAIRDGIARALAVRETKALGWDMLLRLYREEQDYGFKQGLAVAIAEAADGEVLDDVIALLRDTSHGESRGLLLKVLEKSKEPRAHATLVELANDPDLYKEIKVIIKRLERKMERKLARTKERKQKMQ